MVYHISISTYKSRPLTYVIYKGHREGQVEDINLKLLAPKVRFRREDKTVQSELSADAQTSPDIRVELLRITYLNAIASSKMKLMLVLNYHFWIFGTFVER